MKNIKFHILAEIFVLMALMLIACNTVETESTEPTEKSTERITEVEECQHAWEDATCTKPKTCSICKDTDGHPLDHTWQEATCKAPKTCSLCKTTDGQTLAHTWQNATCSAPKTCSTCKATEGKALEHTWADATCTVAKTCSICNSKDGTALGHTWVEATCTTAKICSVCNTKDGEALGHNWQDATCIAPKTCSICKTTDGDIGQHNYVDGKCICGKYDIKKLQTFTIGNHYLEDEKAYVYYVTVIDSNDQCIAADVNVSLNIQNSSSQTLKAFNIDVKAADFKHYETTDRGNALAYQIKITVEDLKEVGFSTGCIKVVLKSQDITGRYTLNITLPVTVILPDLPKLVSYQAYSITRVVKITDISYEVIYGDSLKIYFTGEKTYDSDGANQSSSCYVGWKLYDSEGYVVDSGTFFTDSIKVGDKFKDDCSYAYDCIKPGENYRLEILDVN